MAVAGTIGQKTFDDDLKSLAKLAEDAFGVTVKVDETLGGDWGEHYVIFKGMRQIGTCQTNSELYGILMDATNG